MYSIKKNIIKLYKYKELLLGTSCALLISMMAIYVNFGNQVRLVEVVKTSSDIIVVTKKVKVSYDELEIVAASVKEVKKTESNITDKDTYVKAIEKNVASSRIKREQDEKSTAGNKKIPVVSRGSISNDLVKVCLIDINNPDTDYNGTEIHLSKDDKEFLSRIVMGEAGYQGFEGASLVAQAIRDAMITDKSNIRDVHRKFQYTKNLSREPNENVKNAIEFVFEKGGSAVKHRIMYFYSPKYTKGGKSKWHETQTFVIEYGGHRIFDRKVRAD